MKDRMRRLPLRWMLLLPLLGSLAIGYGAFAFYVERTVRMDLIDTVDEELARVSRNPPQTDGTAGGPSDDATEPIHALLTADGNDVVRPGTASPDTVAALLAADLEPGTATTVSGDVDLRVLTRSTPFGELEVAALEVGSVLASIERLRRSLAVGGAVFLVAQSVLVWVVTRKATRPVVELAATARRVTAGDSDVTVAVSAGPRETQQLAHDLDQMLRELREALDAQTASASDATAARETMARFLADAAHELRTPLTSLRGYTELYERDMLDEPGALDRAMDRIGAESARLERLVASLLELARGAAGSPREHAPVDLERVVADVVDDVRAVHPGRIISTHGEPGVVVLGDGEQLHQAVLNLVANACRHTHPTSAVEVVVRQDASDAVIDVVDHGGGIAAEHRAQVFQPFFQVDQARTNAEGSAGLGLAISRQVVEAHGGTLHLEDTPGGGATFGVRMPSMPQRARRDLDDPSLGGIPPAPVAHPLTESDPP